MSHQPSDFFSGVLVRKNVKLRGLLPQVGSVATLVLRLTEFDTERRHGVCVAHEEPTTVVYRLIKAEDDTLEAYKAWHLDVPHSAHARARKSHLIRQAYSELCDGEI